jgi:hypothetical protein
MTHKLTLEIPDEVYQPLWQQAQATGQSVEAVAGACLAESVQSKAPGGRLRRWGGSWASNVPDAGLRHDDHLGEALADELQERPE